MRSIALPFFAFIVTTTAHALPPAPGTLETVATFDPAALETPESVAIDSHGNLLVSLALRGEIRKIAPNGTQSTYAILPIGVPLTPCAGFVAIAGPLAIDSDDRVFVAVDACDPAVRGIYRVDPNGTQTLLANLPDTSLGNGIALRGNKVYVADSNLGLIWRTGTEHYGIAEVWADHPLLKKPAGALFPGPNGLQLYRNELYVSVSATAQIIAFPIRLGGSAGAPRIHASGIACDDFAFDIHGALYCTTDPFNTVVRVDPDQSQHVLLTEADGLDGPSSTLFGRRLGELRDLYITNGAFPFFPTTRGEPSLMRLRLDVVGHPRP